ncbi:MAG: flagellar basal body rod protein FlgB [Thiobacillaceae bacterium]|nr:flagellar basal body rod protein FlgB [Thiobacillaceae bacterium]
MLSRLDNDLAFVETALKVRARRQEILAANLANADTPNYKARDLDFAAALKSAMNSDAVGLARTSSRHLAGTTGAGAGEAGQIRFRAAVQPSLDGNTVDVDVERAHFAENALHYQFLLERASSAFRNAKLAMESGR